MMPNLFVKKDGGVVQKSYISRTFDEDGTYKQMALPETETKMSLLGNLFVSEGKHGPVLKVECKKRTSADNFVTCMRKILQEKFPEGSIGIGGSFLLANGKAKIHVMPDFSPCPLETDNDVANWLKFYEMSAPMVFLSFFMSSDPVTPAKFYL